MNAPAFGYDRYMLAVNAAHAAGQPVGAPWCTTNESEPQRSVCSSFLPPSTPLAQGRPTVRRQGEDRSG